MAFKRLAITEQAYFAFFIIDLRINYWAIDELKGDGTEFLNRLSI